MKKLTVLCLSLIILMGGYITADAFQSYLTDFITRYPAAGAISQCTLCHNSPSGGSRNSYGSAFGNANHSFAAIESQDSDGDGFTNLAEISASPATFPGNAGSHPPLICTSFTYSAFGECQANNTQTRTVTSSSPAGCTGGNPVLTQACTFVPPTTVCTDFNYSAFGDCQSNNTQTRTVVSGIPAGCTGGTPVLTQACTFVPPGGGTTTTVNVNSATNTGQITVETLTGGTSLTGVTAVSSTDNSVNQSGKPSASDFAFTDGLVSYKITGVAAGGTVQVKITYPSDIPAGSKAYKVDSTGFHEYANAIISGKTITLTLTDGGSGDSDGVANGVIDDPVGVASPVSQSADSDGGGGCSIGARQNRATAFADFAIILMPLFVMAALRRFRRRKQ